MLPPAVRTRRFSVWLPQYVIAAVEVLAEENGEPAEAFLTRELHGIAYEERERLSELIPGFAEAVEWPFGEESAPA